MYVCPLYDNDSGKCGVYEYRPFECRTWPFYVMEQDEKLLITLDPDCPVINGLSDRVINRMVEKNVIPYMVDGTTQFPEYILEYDGERKIIADITEIYKNKINQPKNSGSQT